MRVRLTVIFLGFLVLVIGSLLTTSWLVQTQRNDATIINLAGRQRMLAQQMTHLALTQPNEPELAAIQLRFDQALAALREGGVVLDAGGRSVTLPATRDATIVIQLERVEQIWSSYRRHLQPPIDTDALALETATLLQQLDRTVSAYEAEAQAKIRRLQQVQFMFLLVAFLLLSWGYYTTRRNILLPLTNLGAVARRIGGGNLAEPVPSLGEDELGQLARTLEAMRLEIAAAQELLEQRVGQRTYELSAAFEFSQEIVRQLDLSQLLDSVVRRASDLLQGQAAALCMLQENGRSLSLVASSGVFDNHIGLRQSAQRGIALPVVQQGETVVVEGGCANCVYLRQFPDASCIAAPLQVGGQCLGALCVVHSQGRVDCEESRALTLLANAAAIAIDNARLVEASHKQAEENASLAERQRLAADLHDNLAQTLGAINLKTGMVEALITGGQNEVAVSRVKEMQTAVKGAYTQVRMALTGLSRPLPDEGELAQKLQSCVEAFEAQSNLAADLSIYDLSALDLGPVTQKQALHIVNEALTNIRCHARARQVQIAVTRTDDRARFTITDDGQGFDPQANHGDHHLGLTIMKARAERSGGRLTIQSTPGQGTCITAVFPLES